MTAPRSLCSTAYLGTGATRVTNLCLVAIYYLGVREKPAQRGHAPTRCNARIGATATEEDATPEPLETSILGLPCASLNSCSLKLSICIKFMRC